MSPEGIVYWFGEVQHMLMDIGMCRSVYVDFHACPEGVLLSRQLPIVKCCHSRHGMAVLHQAVQFDVIHKVMAKNALGKGHTEGFHCRPPR
eukprot:359827-Chlamydomonas_euryale.AAC.3